MPHARWSYITLRENFKIPSHQPEAKKILRVSTSLMITKTITIKNKVIVWGLLKIDTEYIAKVPGKTDPVFLAAFEVPCTGFIATRQARPDLVVCVAGEVEYQNLELLGSRDIAAFFIIKIRTGRAEKASIIISNEIPGDATDCPSLPQTQVPVTGKTALEIRRTSARDTWTGRNRY